MPPEGDAERKQRVLATTGKEVAEIISKFFSIDGVDPEINLILAQICVGIGLALDPRNQCPNRPDAVKTLVITAFALGRQSVSPQEGKR